MISCKTTEEIKREKLVENMNDQLNQGQKLSVDNQVKLQQLEESIAQLTGKFEEKKHRDEVKSAEGFKDLSERVRLLEEKNISLENSLKEQKDYLAQVLETLKKFSAPPPPEKKTILKEKKTGPKEKSDFEEGITLFKAGKFSKAEPLLIAALEEKGIKGEKKAKILHALGGINYQNKKFEEAVVYLSRLYTEQPKSSLIPNSLFILGKSFKSSKQNEKAQATFEQLINDFPKSPEATKAKEFVEN